MSQVPYRANLSAKAFVFLSSQFGRTVISTGADQVGGTDTSGDNNYPQAYYMHNVLPTAQGYRSVAYKSIIPSTGVKFDRIFPVRDPDMTRGLIGVTEDGIVYMYRAGDLTWTNMSQAIPAAKGKIVSVAYANGSTYICVSKTNVYKVFVKTQIISPVTLTGINTAEVTAITASANYLIITDGITIYWSSTISPEDFVPSLVTGAGSGKPSDVEGLITVLLPTALGFMVYTATNVAVAIYSQNARYPWVFKRADNSKGVADIQQVTTAIEDGSSYAWTSAGLQRISSVGATTLMAEVTDFLAGQEIEDFDIVTNTLASTYSNTPMKVKLSFVSARYLVISYGVIDFTHALVYDTVLKRWGKLKLKHVACFEMTLNTDGIVTSSATASARKTLGFMLSTGEVVMCNFSYEAEATDAVIIFGKYQLVRSRMTTLDRVCVECVDTDFDFDLLVNTSLDGKNISSQTLLAAKVLVEKYKEYNSRVTGLNHSLIFKGTFNLNSLELFMHINGRR